MAGTEKQQSEETFIYHLSDGPYMPMFSPDLSYVDRPGNAFCEMNSALASEILKVTDHPLYKIPEGVELLNTALVDQCQRELAEREMGLKKIAQPQLEALKLATNEKIRLVMLVSSNDKNNGTLDHAKGFFDKVSLSSDGPEAYAGEVVAGIGAKKWVRAKTRNVLAGSKITFQPSQLAKVLNDFRITDDETNMLRRELSETVTVLLLCGNQRMRKEFQALLDEKMNENPDDPVVTLTGSEMYKYGLAHRIFDSLEEMEAHFIKDLGLEGFPQHPFFKAA